MRVLNERGFTFLSSLLGAAGWGRQHSTKTNPLRTSPLMLQNCGLFTMSDLCARPSAEIGVVDATKLGTFYDF